jgi:hypothetical protein
LESIRSIKGKRERFFEHGIERFGHGIREVRERVEHGIKKFSFGFFDDALQGLPRVGAGFVRRIASVFGTFARFRRSRRR